MLSCKFKNICERLHMKKKKKEKKKRKDKCRKFISRALNPSFNSYFYNVLYTTSLL